MKYSSLSFLLLSLFPIIADAKSTEQEIAELKESLAKFEVIYEHIWIAVAVMVIFLMKGGFLLFEAGLVRSKNTINTAQKNLADTILSSIIFYIIGYNIMFGETVNGLFGWTPSLDFHDVEHTFFIYQIVFCSMVATVVSGALAERIKFSSYMACTFFTTLITYPVFGHWVWGNKVLPENSSYLIDAGFIDFAGSTVVCALGGWVALAALVVIGPRHGKYNEDGSVNPMQASNIVLTGFGAIILWVGAMAFNAGLAHAGSEDAARVMSNTILVGSFSGMTSMILGRLRDGLFRPERCIYGILGGLCAIAAGCHKFTAIDTIIIGIGSGAIVFTTYYLMTHKFKIDDVVCAVPINGFCGAFGTIMVGVLGDPQYFNGNTNGEQTIAQLKGVGLSFVWGFGLSYIFFKLLHKFYGMRVEIEEEIQGLNRAEHGVTMGTGELQDALNKIVEGDGDLTVRLDETTGDESAEIATIFNKFVQKLQYLMVNISQNAKILNTSSSRLSGVSKEFSQNFETIFEQSDKVSKFAENVSSEVKISADASATANESIKSISKNAEKMSGNMEEMSTTVSEMMNSIKQVSTDVNGVSQQTDSAKEFADKASQTVSELEKAATKIDNVVELISKIAHQTNLLALNASIEATKAGEAGQGFAVVANEVKNLSKQTKLATEEISARITEIQKSTNDSSASINEVSEVIDAINESMSHINKIVEKQGEGADIISKNVRDNVENAKTVSESISGIAQNTDTVKDNLYKASGDVDEVKGSVDKFSNSAAENKKSADRVKTTSEDLAAVSDELTKIINEYKI